MQALNHHTMWRTRQLVAFALTQTPTTIQSVFDADVRSVSPAVAMVGEMLTVGDCELMAEEMDVIALLNFAG